MAEREERRRTIQAEENRMALEAKESNA